jgi:poly(3-hydroxybutyrate) depolymerase
MGYLGPGPQHHPEVAHAAAPRGKPDFGIESVTVGGVIAAQNPQGKKLLAHLLKFTRDDLPADAPKLLIVV